MNEELLDYLNGQIYATQATLKTLILMSSHPKELQNHISEQLAVAKTITLDTTLTDDFIAGFDSATKTILDTSTSRRRGGL